MNGRKIARYGLDFEKRVAKAFANNGYALLGRHDWRRNYDICSDYASKREFDLVVFDTYEKEFCIVECKSHINKRRLVGMDLVKEFHHKIMMYRGVGAVAMLVTDTDFTNGALVAARDADMLLLNGAGLVAFERSGSLMGKARSKLYSFAVKKSESVLEWLIKSYIKPF